MNACVRVDRLCTALGLLLIVSIAAAGPDRGNGPDVIIGGIPSSAHWTGGGAVDGLRAYSFGIVTCNVGEAPLGWAAGSAQHPVFVQNLYRLRGGRFEQIGMSWLPHAFCALQSAACSTCVPACGGCCDLLGAGCSNSDTASIGGYQPLMGPRSEVDAFTGQFLFPFGSQGQSGDAVYKRLQVEQGELDLDPSARYFAEVGVISPDDAQAGNGTNNYSHRPAGLSGSYALLFAGVTEREQPAIAAWAAVDPQVQLVAIDVPGEGRFLLACCAQDNGDGTWHYEYAVFNVNSDRSGGALGVPVGQAALSNIGFRDVDYHSGEPFDNTDWASSVAGGVLTWQSPQTYDENPDSNALRFGTLYNFRFDADRPPGPGTIELRLFKPGSPEAVSVEVGCVPDTAKQCPADLDGDGVVDFSDLVILLAAYGVSDAGDIDGNGATDFDDLLILLAAYGSTCG